MGALQQALLMASSGSVGPVVTWNPLDKAADIVLSGSDLVAGRGGGANTNQSVRATLSRGAGVGKWYFEILVLGTVVPASSGISCGFGISTAPLTGFVGSTPVNASWGYAANGGTYTNNTQSVVGGVVTYVGGDVLNFAFDATIDRLWMGKNGVYLNGGNPAAGTNHRYGTPAGALVFPMATIFQGTAGQTITGRFRAADFTYPIPAGFAAWE